MNEITRLLEAVNKEAHECEERLAELRAVQRFLSRSLSGVGHEGQNGDAPAMPAAARPAGSSETLSQADAAEKALDVLGRAAKLREILNLAITQGWLVQPPSAKQQKNMFNSMYGALARHKSRFVLVSPGTWDLVRRRKS